MKPPRFQRCKNTGAVYCPYNHGDRALHGRLLPTQADSAPARRDHVAENVRWRLNVTRPAYNGCYRGSSSETWWWGKDKKRQADRDGQLTVRQLDS